MSIYLNKHQINAIYKFLNSHNHGLILWWNMGTGKTLTAITSIINYPDHNVIIVCPEYIKFVWKKEMKKVGKITNNIKFFNYDTLDKLLLENITDKIVILDEAHNLIPNCRKYNIKDGKMIKHLDTAYKLLLLTGTPFNNDVQECVQLFNIAAGKPILPYNIHDFKKKYYIINKQKVLYRGYIIECLSKISFLASSSIFYSGINPYVTFISIFMLLFTYFLGLMIKYDINEYKKLNTPKFLNDVKKYINYYDNTYTDKLNYPKVNIHYKKIEYDLYQIKMWYTLTQDILPTDYIEKIDIVDYEDIDYYSQQLDMKTYLKKGALIGNVSSKKDYPKKFYEILQIAQGKRAVFYSGSLNAGIKQFENFLKHMDERYIFLNDGIDNLEKFKIIDKFKNENIFLLLHPIYVEGITIYGAEQLHIIEPLESFSHTKQLMGRVARYKTHVHLPPSKRKVDIYQWSCVCAQKWSSVPELLKKQYARVNSWLTNRLEVFYTLSGTKYSQDLTPDSLLLIKTTELFKVMEEISTYFYKNDEKIDMKCCIKFPNKKQENLCIKTKKSCFSKEKNNKRSKKKNNKKSNKKSKKSKKETT